MGQNKASPLTAPVILSGRGGPSEAKDQDRHHVVVIETMLEQWPDVDIVNYASATSPGYHFALAAVNPSPGGSMSPFCDPVTVTSTPQASW